MTAYEQAQPQRCRSTKLGCSCYCGFWIFSWLKTSTKLLELKIRFCPFSTPARRAHAHSSSKHSSRSPPGRHECAVEGFAPQTQASQLRVLNPPPSPRLRWNPATPFGFASTLKTAPREDPFRAVPIVPAELGISVVKAR